MELKPRQTVAPSLCSQAWNPRSLGIITAFLVTFLIFAYLSHSGHLSQIMIWIGELGLIGNAFVVVLYIVTSFPVPMGTTPLALSAGFLYGWFLGFITVTIGSVVGAVIAFLFGRRLFSDYVALKLKENITLQALMNAVEQHSFKICFFVRMSPLPFGFQNCLFAISKISFHTYTLATILGLFPEQLMLVYFGSTAKEMKDIFDGKSGGKMERLLVAAQVVVTIIILVFLVRIGKKALNDAVNKTQSNQTPIDKLDIHITND